MKILKKWDLWYWLVIIIFMSQYAPRDYGSGEELAGIGVATALVVSILLYAVIKAIQLIFRNRK